MNNDNSKKNNKGSLLGNRITALRKTFGMTMEHVAERLNLSSSFISQIESGKRGCSKDTLIGLSNLFNVPYEELELLSLNNTVRKEEFHEDLDTIYQDAKLQPKIYEFALLLNSLDEQLYDLLLPSFKKQIESEAHKLLKPFDFREIKKIVIGIREWWKQNGLKSVKELEFPFTWKVGFILSGENRTYFSMEFDGKCLCLTLLYDNRNEVANFEMWFGKCDLSYNIEDKIIYLAEPQKVTRFLWFSPFMSNYERALYVTHKGIDKVPYDVGDSQLLWFLSNVNSDKEVASFE